MWRSFQFTGILLAWFLATGGQWDLVQTYGWGRMFVNYSRTMSFGEAVKKTFDGEMCGVCKAVNDAKQQENKASVPGGKRDIKISLFLQPAVGVYFDAPKFEPWSLGDQIAVTTERAAPPLPPPRMAVA